MRFSGEVIGYFKKMVSAGLRNFCIIISLSLIIVGCEKSVDFRLKDEQDKLVVEATIENGQPPVVILSKSFNYFSKINPQILAQSFVHNAEVYISNGTKTHKLKEYSVPLDSTYNLFFYSIDSSDLLTAFLGELNKQYSLRIVHEGKEYTAITTIPNITKQVDSIWWKKAPLQEDTTRVIIMAKVKDPPGFGDYVRYWTKRNQEPYLAGYNSVFDDFVIDGTTYEIEVNPGINRNGDFSEEERFFNRGDTVNIKLSNIDKTTYDFWRTMEYSYGAIGNPFSSPTKVLGNIQNGALGYFGGYASQFRTIIIPQ